MRLRCFLCCLQRYIAAEQKQSLSAGQVQSLQILELTNQEPEDFMVNEYLENPMLENAERKEDEIITSIEKFSDAEDQTAYADQNPGSPAGDEPYRREKNYQRQQELSENQPLKTGETAAHESLSPRTFYEYQTEAAAFLSTIFLSALRRFSFFAFGGLSFAAKRDFLRERLPRIAASSFLKRSSCSSSCSRNR